MRKLLLLCVAAMALTATAQDAPAQDTLVQEKSTPSWLQKVGKYVKVKGFAMVDWRYSDKAEPSNEFSVEKIIFTVQGRFTDKLSAQFMFDFRKVSMHELWMNYAPCKGLNIKVGQFKTPFSIENPISPAILETVNINSLVTTDMIMGTNPLMMPGGAGRDIGITVYGNLFNDKLSYDLAVMNGAGRNCKDINSAKDYVARLSYRPIKELMLSGSMVLGTGNVEVTEVDGTLVCNAAPGVTGFKANGNFARNRFAAGCQLETKPFNLRAEYMWGKDGDYNSSGCYATGVLNNFIVNKLDVIASYDHLNNFMGIQNRYTAGLQYWVYKACRLQVNYVHHKWHGQPGENCVLTQAQVAF